MTLKEDEGIKEKIEVEGVCNAIGGKRWATERWDTSFGKWNQPHKRTSESEFLSHLLYIIKFT
jgi:hypothetical protein